MNYYQLTKKYYATKIDLTEDELDSYSLINYLPKDLQNQDCSLYSYLDSQKAVICFTQEIAEKISQVKILNQKICIASSLFQVFPEGQLSALYAKVATPAIINTAGVRFLEKNDFTTYSSLGFTYQFAKEQFLEKVQAKKLIGYFIFHDLVSFAVIIDETDLYKKIFVETILNERNKGYAKKVAKFAVDYLISQEKCPLWEHDSLLFFGQKLGEAVGFRYLADQFVFKKTTTTINKDNN